MELTEVDAEIMVVLHYENDCHVLPIVKDTKFEQIVDGVCDRWPILTADKVVLKYTILGQVNSTVTLFKDLDVRCMFQLHHKAMSSIVNIDVSSRVVEMDSTMDDRRSTKRSKYDSNSCAVESSQCLRKVTEIWENEISHVGQEFKDANHFRQSLCNFSISWNFNFQYIRNERTKITAICKSDGCGWRVHASKVGLCDRFEIKKLINVHICGGGLCTVSHPRASRNWVANITRSKLMERPLYRPVEIMKDISSEYGVQVPYHTVWHSKEVAMKEMHGDLQYSYDMLRWYCDAARKSNPGSVLQLEADPESKRFKRLFVSFHAPIVGFDVGCRPLLFLDGTFLKSKYHGILLAATGLNGNNGIFSLAYGIVDQETCDNWEWFLTLLRRILSNERKATFISDRAKGLSASVPRIFPGSHHSYCLRHLIENFKTDVCNKYSGAVRTRLVDLFKRCAYAYTEEEFDIHYATLSSESSLAKQFINNSGKHHWAHAFFDGDRYGNVYSNVAESYNAWILEARHLPITQCVDHIRNQIMEMSSKRKVEAIGWESELCPDVEKELMKNIRASRGIRCSTSVPLSVIAVHDDPSVTVYLDTKKCECRLWQIFQIPCVHACAAIQLIERSVYDFCNPYFKTELFRAAYEEAIYPISTIGRPPVDQDNVQIKPLRTKKRPGRNRKKRIPSATSDTQPIQCGRCKQYGRHNRKTCTASIED